MAFVGLEISLFLKDGYSIAQFNQKIKYLLYCNYHIFLI